MTDRQKRFIDLLRTIFELDKSDLDFGIYRILNIRSAEIEKFFTEELPKKITETLAPFAQGDTGELKAEMKRIEDDAIAFGTTIEAMPDNNPKKQRWDEIRRQLAQGTDIAALESDVYSALYSFFNRYYDEGDFISKRRYKEGVYAIPYEGEEVKLYWANQDQYYIKTSENFKDYTFVADDVTVHFRIVEATTEQNNNKEADDKKRQFMLFQPNEETHPGLETFSYDSDRRELIIRFTYDIPADTKKKTDKWTEENFKAISQYILDQHQELMPVLLKDVSAKHDGSLLLMMKHLKGYVAKNTFDYFIHKDLGGFLTRELDFYIKNEIMHLDDLDTASEARVNTYLAKVRAIKRVGKIIIAFLAQLENFQKKLWLKKKFVVETQWCITLDRVPEEFYSEIAANAAQVQEWIDMYAIDEVQGDGMFGGGFTNPPTVDFLKANQHLLVDTRHFTEQFKQRLIATIDNLDEATNGIVINSENYHALNLLSQRYRDSVSCCYYDPPYNTTEGSFIYKNGYKDSSWGTMYEDRVTISKSLLSDSGIICTAIDDYEHSLVERIMDQTMGFESRLGNLVIEIKPSGRTNDYFLATSHEYIVFYAKNYNSAEICFFNLTEEQLAQYKETDEGGAHKWRDFMRTGGYSTPEERPNSFYPIFYNEKTGEISLDESEGTIKILPIDTSGRYRVWRKTKPSFLIHLAANEIKVEKARNSDGYKVRIIDRVKTGIRPKSAWIGSRYDAATYGTKYIKSMFGEKSPFSFPKSIYAVYDTLYTVVGDNPKAIILDIFAGSGTTAEAVIKLNKDAVPEDYNSNIANRKYILVEMGEYFDTVTLPRIKKVVYSSDWSNGKPTARDKGVSQIVKYMRLESYEDALSNIELKKQGTGSLFGDDYLLHYMLDIEARGSLLNVEAFTNPFDYKLRITEHNATHKKVVDVVETFNYLIGLTVINEGAVNYFRAVDAAKPDYEGAVDLVRDANGEYAFRLIEGKLPDGRKALVIWRTMGTDLVRTNAALDAYFRKNRINPRESSEYDVIYVNGDNNLLNLRTDDEHWKVVRTETAFNDKMWEEDK